MLADVTPVALIVVIILILLLVGGLIADRLMARKGDRPGAPVRQRPRFVRTLVRATMRFRRNKGPDPSDEQKAE